MRSGAVAYVARRLAVSAFLVWAMTVVVFVLFFLIPAEPTNFIVRGASASEFQRELAREQLGLDDPAYVVYGRWIWRLVHGDLGVSWKTIAPSIPEDERIHVGERLVGAAGVTGALAVGGVILLIVIAVPLGIASATRPNATLDRTTTFGAIAIIALPPVVVGLVLQTFVANHWGLLPSSGYCALTGTGTDEAALAQGSVEPCGGPVDWASHLVLPWLTFALFFVALYTRMVRARMLDVLGELIGCFTWFYPARLVRASVLELRGREFVDAARMVGASDWRIARQHLFPHLWPQLIVYGTLLVATNITLEAGLTFLGVGIEAPTASWGQLLSQTWGSARNPMVFSPSQTQVLLTLWPSLAIFFTVLSLHLLGEGLRDALDPRGTHR